jgi:hypothetical protein
MLTGLLEVVKELRVLVALGGTFVAIKPPAAIATSYTWTLPNALPGSSSALIVATDGTISYGASGGGGVSSVGLSLPSIFTVTGSPVTTSGTLTATFASQSASQFLASPSGSSGAPTMRSIGYADISSFVGTTANTVAAGNDSRFHNQNTDTGTDAS